MTLRHLIESDLSITLEGDFALPVVLVSPDGVVYNEGNDGKPLVGQVLYDSLRLMNPEGETSIVDQPLVTLRLSNLPRVPENREKWFVHIPATPVEGAPMKMFMLGKTRPMEFNRSIGFVRIYLQAVKQS